MKHLLGPLHLCTIVSSEGGYIYIRVCIYIYIYMHEIPHAHKKEQKSNKLMDFTIASMHELLYRIK